MKNHNDPRLMIFSGGVGDPANPSSWNTDPAAQVGMPNGYNSQQIPAVAVAAGLIATEDDYDRNIYSFINPKLYDFEDPMIFQTYAEVELLLAEAAVKGWNVGGSAEAHFNNGVTASVNQWVVFDPGFAVDAAAVSAYVSGLGFGAASTTDKERMIGEQYWASTFFNHYEGYSNWRRTGYPVLTPTNYPGNLTGGEIPRRLIYPSFEQGSNPDNYTAAVAAQGPDLLTTRIWWDVN
jgi:hypothetical protein